ncbi:MAG: insulinase family protein, partial [Gammaproteobacteria bacterium]
RLFLELRDLQGLAYAVNAMNLEGLAPGFFAIYIACAPEKLDAARAGIMTELERVLQSQPDITELERARRYLIGNHAIDRQRSSTRASQMALDVRYGLGLGAARELPEAIAAVDADAVLRAARRVIDLDAYTLALIRP